MRADRGELLEKTKLLPGTIRRLDLHAIDVGSGWWATIPARIIIDELREHLRIQGLALHKKREHGRIEFLKLLEPKLQNVLCLPIDCFVPCKLERAVRRCDDTSLFTSASDDLPTNTEKCYSQNGKGRDNRRSYRAESIGLQPLDTQSKVAYLLRVKERRCDR
jgi:hypothetical protein